MVEGRKQGVMVLDVSQNHATQIQTKLKEFDLWLSHHSAAVETAVAAASAAAQGAAFGGVAGGILGAIGFTGGPLIQARNVAVMSGVNDGIDCVMKRLRGKEDVKSRMVAGFGSGAMLSLVNDMGTPNQAANVVKMGIFLALLRGGLFKVLTSTNQLAEKISQSPVEDVCYTKTKSLLANLGLQNYEKNFKNSLLTDTTLPLLNDNALRDAKIPPGPRLLILDHIQRDPELKGSRRGL